MNQTHTLRLRVDVLRVLRELRGLETDQDLAAAMGVHRASVSRVLRGKSEPGPRFLGSLCAALDATPNDLLAVVPEVEEVAA